VTGPVGLSYQGDPTAIVAKASLVGKGKTCPAHVWGELRPQIRLDVKGWWRRNEPFPFMLGAVIEAVRQMEEDDVPQADAIATAVAYVEKGRGFHPAVARFVAHAISTLLETGEARAAMLGVSMELSDERLIDWYPGRTLRCWAMSYDSPDRTVREVRRLRFNRAVPGPSPEPDLEWAAVAAKLAVDGRRETMVRPDPVPGRVIVVEIGLGDGSQAVLFDGDAQAARAFYDRVAKDRINQIADATSFVPGRDCGSCYFLAGCPALPNLRGVLGLPGQAAITRSVAASDLDRYARCPAAYYLGSLAHLPREYANSDAQRRGNAVPRWLKAAHGRATPTTCTEEDLPDDGPLPEWAEHLLTNEEYALARSYLLQHVRHCVIGFDGLESIQVEPPIYIYDTDADVVVAVEPDLAFVTGNGPVWRETKSTIRVLPADPLHALRTFTAAALDVVVLADLTKTQAGEAVGVVEVEVLGRADSAVYSLYLDDEPLVAEARRLVAGAALQWSQDLDFVATPSADCAQCAVGRWCPARNENSTTLPNFSRNVEAEIDNVVDDVPF
jgi:hypothetical protein